MTGLFSFCPVHADFSLEWRKRGALVPAGWKPGSMAGRMPGATIGA